jgi:hypothetical protein
MSFLQIILMVVPSVTYPLICLSYILVLRQKRDEVNRLFQGQTLEIYQKAYGVKDLFKQYYNWIGYILPILLIMLTVILVTYTLMVKYGVVLLDPSHFLSSLKNTADTVIAGFIGAYIWTHYEMLRRYYIIDLSPVRLYYFWLRFLVSAVLAYLFGLALQPPTNLVIAFAIGAFPVRTLVSFLRGQAQDKLKITDEIAEFEKPNLHLLQGMTKNVIEQLNEENIYSTEQLALANPIRLLMRTNIEWTIILDLIDQAIAFNYIGEKISDLRKSGIRCAMELGDLQEGIEAKKTQTLDLVKKIAEKLSCTESEVINLISVLVEDDQLYFITNLWEEAFPKIP